MAGHLDIVTTTGLIEGWAYDIDDPLTPLEVSIRVGNEEVARGLAHRHRADLVEAGCGVGWCAFSLRLDRPAESLASRPVSLFALRGNRKICEGRSLPMVDPGAEERRSLEDIVADDPTATRSASQLAGCSEVFEAAFRANGPHAFVRSCYAYALNRAETHDERARQVDRLTRGAVSPLGLVQELLDSEAFFARGFPPPAPTDPSFPFRPS